MVAETKLALPARATPTRAARGFAVVNLLSSALVSFGVFVALPARYWPVDCGGALVAALLLAAAVGLVWGRRAWGPIVAHVASWVVLALGLALVATLALTASYLSGIYGPVGRGGAIILVLVSALAVPYLVALPAAQLLWLSRFAPWSVVKGRARKQRHAIATRS